MTPPNLMADTWTKATKAYRRFKGGRPKMLGTDKLTPLQVVHRLFSEIDRAHGVMKEEGLDNPTDLTWELRYYTPATRTTEPAIQDITSADVEGTSTQDALALLSKIAKLHEPLFIGIMWTLMDREAIQEEWEDEMSNGVPLHWRTLFNAYPWNYPELITATLQEERKQTIK